MSLRTLCIEAAYVAYYGGKDVDPIDDIDRKEWSAVLDAVLAVLTDHAAEWADYPEPADPMVVAVRGTIARKLLAVLKEEDG